MTEEVRISVQCGLVGVALVCNVYGPALFWEARAGQPLQYLAFVAAGALVAEVCLLAIWLAFGVQSIRYRVPITGALVVIVACSYCIGLQLPGDDMPMEVALVILGAAFGMFLALQLPLWGLRRLTHFRIGVRGKAAVDSRLKDSQFNTSYLMGWAAAVGILVVLVRHSFPAEWAGGRILSSELAGIISAGLVYVASSAALCIPCVWVALDEPTRFRAVLWLVAALLFAPVVVNATVTFILNVGTPDAIIGNYCYATGVSGTTLLVLLILRRLGYRLIRA